MHNISLETYGLLGGVVAQLLSLLDLKNIPKDKRPDFKDWAYYIPWVIQPCLGWFLTSVYISSNFPMNSVLAVNVGASAPLLLKSLMSSSLIDIKGNIDQNKIG